MYDESKIEDAVLALFGAFEFEGGRVWKKFDFDVMNSLYSKGYITSPIGRTHSVNLTAEGLTKAKSCADRLFKSEEQQT
jgi:hypothetical protein